MAGCHTGDCGNLDLGSFSLALPVCHVLQSQPVTRCCHVIVDLSIAGLGLSVGGKRCYWTDFSNLLIKSEVYLNNVKVIGII